MKMHSSNINIKKLLSRPDDKLTLPELQLVIYARLYKVYPKTATYEHKVKQLIREYLPTITSMNPVTVAPVIKNVRTLIRRDEWVNVVNMFKGIFVFLAKARSLHHQYNTIELFIMVYPEFRDLPEDEKKALFEYRNMTVAALQVFDPKDKKNDFFNLVGRTFGPSQSAYFESSLFTTRRTLIFERETSNPSTSVPSYLADSFAQRKRARVSPTPIELSQGISQLPAPSTGPSNVHSHSTPVVLTPEQEAAQGRGLLHEAMMEVMHGRTPTILARAPLYSHNGKHEHDSALLPALHYLTRAYGDQRVSQYPFRKTVLSNHQDQRAHLPSHQHTADYVHSAQHRGPQWQRLHARYLQDQLHGAIPLLLLPPNPHDVALAAKHHPSLATPVLSPQEILADPVRYIHGALPVSPRVAPLTASASAQSSTLANTEQSQMHRKGCSVPASLARNPHTAQMCNGQNKLLYQAYLQYLQECGTVSK